MKKWIVLLVVLFGTALLGVGGHNGEDIGRLMPVQLIMAEYKDGIVTVQTDTGHSGTGKDVATALQDMDQAAEGKLFLDTADYLLVRKSAQQLLTDFTGELRPSCAVYRYTGEIDPEAAAVFLQYHVPELTLGMYVAEEKTLPLLSSVEGRMELEQ